MLRNAQGLTGYTLRASDGEIGRCKDFLFDDQHWTVRYMVADTGKWLPGRRVLISPISLGEPDWGSRLFPVRLTKKEIQEAPDLAEDAPASRQYEIKFHQHYRWPYYWGGLGAWGAGAHPAVLYEEKLADQVREDEEDTGDPHLRSVGEVTGYHLQAQDGEIGHVEDFVLDDGPWSVRYMVVDTRNWLPGKKVLVAPSWIDAVDWSQKRVQVGMTRDAIKASPEYDSSAPVNREYEVKLYDFYGRPRYWS